MQKTTAFSIFASVALLAGSSAGLQAQQANMSFFITSVGLGKGADLGGLAGAEIVPYSTYSTRSTFEFLAEAAKRSVMILPFMAKARAMPSGLSGEAAGSPSPDD